MSGINLPPADELASVRDQIRALQQRETELRTLMLTDPAARTGNAYVAEVRKIEQARTDLKELRAMYPQEVDEHTHTSTVTQIVLRGINEDGEIVTIRRAQP